MRRTVPVPTAVASRAPRALIAVFLVALLALVLTLVAPVSAQEETTSQAQTATKAENTAGKHEQSVRGSGQRAENGETQTVDPLEGQTANVEGADDNGIPDSIGPIAVAGCEAVAGETPSITVADEVGAGNATGQTLTDGENAEFQFEQQGITITAKEGDELKVEDFDDDTGEVVSSEGIVCDGSAQRSAEDDEGNDARDNGDLEDLSCAELLVLFRAASSGEQQYFADSDVRAQVEVCLEEEIIKGTAADESLPETGGLSLVGLAVLGVVSAAVGLSVIRGGRRQG